MTLEKTNQAARGKWRDILTHFGMGAEFLTGEHGACPLCGGGKDRWRWDNKDGTGSCFCSQCGAKSGMHILMDLKGWDFTTAAREVDKILGVVQVEVQKAQRTKKDKVAALKRLLGQGQPLAPGTPSWLYLDRRCGDPSGLQGLRHHPALRYSREDPATYPALLATLRYPDGKGASVHRTYLTPDGRKADLDPVRKIMPGLPLEGSAVQLAPAQERLGLAEGIETAISAGKLFGLPVWAGISANGILAWVPPELVRSVVIFGDNDRNYVGQAAAYEKARQLVVKGFAVEVLIPPRPGDDWNDVWAAKAQLQGVA